MHKKHLICTFVIIADIIVTLLTAGPSWNTPSSTTLSKTLSECGTGITSLDASSTDGSSVVYSIVSQDPNGNFVVVDNPIPPFEKQLRCTEASITASSYSVTVRATHNGGNGEHTDLTLTIYFTNVVPDLGGEAPVFVNPDPNSSSIDVLETIQAGDTILTLSATDADSDDSTLTFNMAASPSATTALFEITGNLLKVKAGVATNYFDVEEVSAVTQFRINLEVSDKSSSTTMETNINIYDVNDNPPVFSGSTSASIGENVPEGYIVLTVTATDNDKTTANNQVTLSLADISEFHLEGNDLKVSAGANFDASTKSNYRLNITASDNVPGDPKTTSQVYDVSIKAGLSENCERCSAKKTENAALITSISLGVAFAVLAIYAASITILYKRKKTENKDKHVDVKESTHKTYANIAYKPNEQDNDNNDGTTEAEGKEARQDTDLVGYSHEDKTTYEVLQDI